MNLKLPFQCLSAFNACRHSPLIVTRAFVPVTWLFPCFNACRHSPLIVTKVLLEDPNEEDFVSMPVGIRPSL